MDTDREALLNEALQVHKMVIASIVQQKAFLLQWLDLDISMAQFKGMIVLHHLRQSTISEFAEKLHIGRSAASLLVDRLVQDKLVERTEGTEDRRHTVIRLSPYGVELLDRLRRENIELQLLPNWLGKLSTSDLQALTQGLHALATVIQAETGVIDPWPTCQVQEPQIS